MRPLAWAALPVLALGVGVQASGVGIDLLFVAAAGLCLLTLERTLGDLLSDTIGVIPGTALFALFVAGFTWYAIGSSDDFFAAAEKRGYRSVYYGSAQASAESVKTSDIDSSPSAPPAVRTASGSRQVRAVARGGGSASRASVASDGGQSAAEAAPGVPAGQNEPAQSTTSSGLSAVASRVIFGPPDVPASPPPTSIALTIAPPKVPPARRTLLQAAVTSQGRPVDRGTVEFVVNGTTIARVQVDARGIATIPFVTHLAGAYDVRALFLGTDAHRSGSSTVRTLSVAR
jgi:hypothetical protein